MSPASQHPTGQSKGAKRKRTPLWLLPGDKAVIDRLKKRWGLRSRMAVLRRLAEMAPKKRGKKS